MPSSLNKLTAETHSGLRYTRSLGGVDEQVLPVIVDVALRRKRRAHVPARSGDLRVNPNNLKVPRGNRVDCLSVSTATSEVVAAAIVFDTSCPSSMLVFSHRQQDVVFQRVQDDIWPGPSDPRILVAFVRSTTLCSQE